MKKIYLASPFFDSHELNIYKMVIAELRGKGYEVYVPQEHEIENAWEKPNFVWGGEVFVEDLRAIDQCDVMLILNFGMYSDSGTAWEAGYAFGNKVPTVQVLCGAPNTTYSLMMINGCDKIVRLADVANWEEESASVDLATIIQK